LNNPLRYTDPTGFIPGDGEWTQTPGSAPNAWDYTFSAGQGYILAFNGLDPQTAKANDVLNNTTRERNDGPADANAPTSVRVFDDGTGNLQVSTSTALQNEVGKVVETSDMESQVQSEAGAAVQEAVKDLPEFPAIEGSAGEGSAGEGSAGTDGKFSDGDESHDGD
jgi:hypothetical protein